MIKKSIYILCTSLALGCSACDDWLTVVPETTLIADNLLETDEGILQVLDGAYVLAASNVYKPTGYLGGGGCVEEMADTWTKDNSSWANHEYDIDNSGVANTLDAMFMQIYKIINTLNPMIEACDKNKDKYREEYYNIVKGEALAFRACLHLDLIRIWGPMPKNINPSTEYLPYVTQNSIQNYQYYTFDKYMELLLRDLNEAEELLKKSDPIVTRVESSDWSDREAHFNYYGVLGLQARARLWMNDTEGAMRYAKMVIEAKGEDGTAVFTLATADNYVDRTFYPEHLCSINQDNFDYQQTGFANSQNLNSYNNRNYSTFVSDLFDGNANDLRLKQQWSYLRSYTGQYVRITRKYDDMYPSNSSAARNMPLVRLAEMYLILMEVGTLEEANVAYETLCAARGVDYVALTESDRTDRVLMEWIRELIAEGQNFYTYKRFAVKRMLWQDAETADCGEEQYVLPLPPSERR